MISAEIISSISLFVLSVFAGLAAFTTAMEYYYKEEDDLFDRALNSFVSAFWGLAGGRAFYLLWTL